MVSRLNKIWSAKSVVDECLIFWSIFIFVFFIKYGIFHHHLNNQSTKQSLTWRHKVSTWRMREPWSITLWSVFRRFLEVRSNFIGSSLLIRSSVMCSCLDQKRPWQSLLPCQIFSIGTIIEAACFWSLQLMLSHGNTHIPGEIHVARHCVCHSLGGSCLFQTAALPWRSYCATGEIFGKHKNGLTCLDTQSKQVIWRIHWHIFSR